MPAIQVPVRPAKKNYWKSRDPRDFTAAQKEFVDVLNLAITRAGTQEALAQHLSKIFGNTIYTRKIQFWLKGVGPSRTSREKFLPELKRIIGRK